MLFWRRRCAFWLRLSITQLPVPRRLSPRAWLRLHVWHQSSWNSQPPVLTPDTERGVRVGYTKHKKGIKVVLREKMRSGHNRDCPNTELKRWGSRPLALWLTRLCALRAISEHVTTNKKPILHSWEAYTGRNVQLYLGFLFGVKKGTNLVLPQCAVWFRCKQVHSKYA